MNVCSTMLFYFINQMITQKAYKYFTECIQTTYLRETGCPTEAPCMRSLRRFTRRLVVFSPITKLIASIKFDLPI
jgi:hypothetical protein